MMMMNDVHFILRVAARLMCHTHTYFNIIFVAITLLIKQS